MQLLNDELMYFGAEPSTLKDYSIDLIFYRR
jgi:hypothetical protein